MTTVSAEAPQMSASVTRIARGAGVLVDSLGGAVAIESEDGLTWDPRDSWRAQRGVRVIAFGASMTSPELYERWAKPGVELACEPDSQVLAIQGAGSLFRSYNLILEQAAAFGDLEALVLVHQDVEIVDRDLCAKLRETLRDPEVGVVGCLGAVGARSIAWWEGSVTWSSSVYRYGDAGGGDVPALAWNGDQAPPYVRTGEVDTLDGSLLALSPWTVRNIRFDESLGQRHGHDFDLCMQARAAGRKVMTADLKVVHHHSLHLITDNEPWVAAHMRVAQKWAGEADESDWKQRARRAEAEAAAGRLLVASKQYQADAMDKEQERRLDEVRQSLSWRSTAPLRWLNARRRTGRPGPA
jgi:Glycosyltransferase like family